MRNLVAAEIIGGASLPALESVYRRDYRDFLRVATAITGTTDSGQDAVHDAFVGLIRSRRAYRRHGSVEAWVWAAVVNASRKHARNHRDLRLTSEAREEAHGADLMEYNRREIRAIIAHLPERQRLALFLRYYTDLDYVQIAQALGVSTGTVAASLHAAHKTLRRELREVSDDA